MTYLVVLWKKYWFAPANALNLAIVRFIVCSGGAVFFSFMRDIQPESFYRRWDPISFYHLLPGPVPADRLELVRYAWLFFTFLAGLGIYFRFTAVVGYFCGLFFLGYTYNFGSVYHSTHVYIMALGILAFSRAGDAYRFFQRGPAASPSGAYRWPVQLIKAYTAMVFFTCGLQKLWSDLSFGWAFSDSFYLRLLLNPAQPPLSRWIMEQPVWVSKAFASGAFFVAELFAPLALLSPWASAAYAFGWTFFHWMVTLTFGIHTMFYSQVLVYSAFLDWEKILNWSRSRRNASG